jgi:hypothetical protein
MQRRRGSDRPSGGRPRRTHRVDGQRRPRRRQVDERDHRWQLFIQRADDEPRTASTRDAAPDSGPGARSSSRRLEARGATRRRRRSGRGTSAAARLRTAGPSASLAHSAPARPRQPRHDQHLPAGHRHRGDHRRRAHPAGAEDVSDRRTPALTNAPAAGASPRRSRPSRERPHRREKRPSRAVRRRPSDTLDRRPVQEPAQVPPTRPHPPGTGDVGVLQGTSPPSRRVGQDCRKASRSALIVSAWVVGMPCGNPL